MKANPFARRFAAVIAEERNRLAYTQEALAAKAGIHRTYVGDIENARKSPTVAVAYAIAQALDLPLSELIVRAERGTGR